MIHQEQFQFNKNIKFNFAGGDLTSDAGLLLVYEFMNKVGFKSLLNQYFSIKEDKALRRHTNIDLCLQQILQFIAGYHCADHADELTTEPLLTKLLSKSALASQPTLSRFAHRLDDNTVQQLRRVNQLLLDRYYQIEYPDHFIFDIDSTNFQTFGNQDGQAFNGHYSEMGYHPLLVFDGMTKDCLKVELRPGNVYTSKDSVQFLEPILSHYHQEFEGKCRIVRGDSGFASSEIYDLCEKYQTQYLIRLKSNAALVKLAAPLASEILKEECVQDFKQVIGEFSYQAKSWSKARRVIVQVTKEAGEWVPSYMFLVTDMETEKKDYIIKFYGKRGTMENFIKECKGGFRMDKVSHSTLEANENRVQQVMLAYNLINGFRRLTLPPVFRHMTVETLRVKLFKVAARCIKKARGIIFKICSFYPYQSIFRQTLKNIQKIQWE